MCQLCSLCCSPLLFYYSGRLVIAYYDGMTSDGSLATESVQMNESLTRTNQNDYSLSCVSFVSFDLRLDSSQTH